jgi:hypothetical protein
MELVSIEKLSIKGSSSDIYGVIIQEMPNLTISLKINALPDLIYKVEHVEHVEASLIDAH